MKYAFSMLYRWRGVFLVSLLALGNINAAVYTREFFGAFEFGEQSAEIGVSLVLSAVQTDGVGGVWEEFDVQVSSVTQSWSYSATGLGPRVRQIFVRAEGNAEFQLMATLPDSTITTGNNGAGTQSNGAFGTVAHNYSVGESGRWEVQMKADDGEVLFTGFMTPSIEREMTVSVDVTNNLTTAQNVYFFVGDELRGSDIVEASSRETLTFPFVGNVGASGSLAGGPAELILTRSDPILLTSAGSVIERAGYFGEKPRVVVMRFVLNNFTTSAQSVFVEIDGNTVGELAIEAGAGAPKLKTYAFNVQVTSTAAVEFATGSGGAAIETAGERGERFWTYIINFGRVGSPWELTTQSSPSASGVHTNVTRRDDGTTVVTTAKPPAATNTNTSPGGAFGGTPATAGGVTSVPRASGDSAADTALLQEISNTVSGIEQIALADRDSEINKLAKRANDLLEKPVTLGDMSGAGGAAADAIRAVYGNAPTGKGYTIAPGGAPNLSVTFPAAFGGQTFNLNPFTSERLGPVASWFRSAVAWLALVTFGGWVWSEIGSWTRGVSMLPQAKGNTVAAGTGGQATALAAAGLITAAIIIGTTVLLSWSFDDINLPSIIGAVSTNPVATMASGSLWLLDQMWPVATLITVLVARIAFRFYAAALFAGVAAAIRFIVP